MLKGFKNFLMRGDVIVVAMGLIVALAFSTLIKAFTDFVINPIIARAQGSHSAGLGWQLGQAGNKATYLDIGSFISAVIYFIIFMAVVYFLIVVPYKHFSARRGVVVFEAPGPVKTCPACLCEDLPAAATKCRHCGSEQPPSAGASQP
ncbi:large conductance mechanosensitive channel protein MscL [Streptomyces broussonetiae]|uniref:large conductance mechanosensitive channel protein MscL n=1 Tax=Streptomyces broussonetiae TaxID=2686304 RepID=UPI0035D8DD79